MEILLALATVLTPVQETPVRDLDQLEQVLAAGLAELREARGFPGATAAFCLDDGAARAVAVGFSDLEREAAMEPDSRMLAGSTGKTFVAATVLQLVAFVLGREPLFAVGAGFAYADTNYVLAAMMVERLVGRSYYEELRERLLERFELADTLPQDARVLPGLVPGYTTEGNPFGLPRKVSEEGRHAMNPQMEYGGGGVMSTSGDLARWAVALYHGGAIPAGLMGDVLESRPAPRVGRGMEYGLGVVVGSDRNGPHWGHTGWFPGYGTLLAYYPEHGLGFALQVNTDDASQLEGFPHGWAEALVEALIREN